MYVWIKPDFSCYGQVGLLFSFERYFQNVFKGFVKVNRQRLKFVMRRTELKIPTLAKSLISPLVRVIIKICKKDLVLKDQQQH